MFKINRKGAQGKFGVLCIVFVVVALLFAAATFQYVREDMYLAIVMVFFMSTIAVSASLGFGLKLTKPDWVMSKYEMTHMLMFVAGGIALSVGLQFIILQGSTKMSIADVWGRKMFYGVAAIAETCLFQLLLLTLLERGIRLSALNCVVISLAFAPFHAAVYGLANTALMFAVFATSMVFCLMYVWSGYMVIVPLLIHFIVNIIGG